MCVSINVPHRLTCFCKRLTHKSGSEKILPGTALNLFGILCAQQRYDSQLSSRMFQHAPVNVFSRHVATLIFDFILFQDLQTSPKASKISKLFGRTKKIPNKNGQPVEVHVSLFRNSVCFVNALDSKPCSFSATAN